MAKTIVAREAGYLLAVKKNQPKLRQAVACALHNDSTERVASAQKGHGRTVLQHVVIAPAEGIVDAQTRPDCKTVGRVMVANNRRWCNAIICHSEH
ncbi:hypothetical protein BUE93_18015 [Chromobacterium amazonense]|uniref:Uncharacterized protein n=1 Tax=Chromobacterium amazonense TaxID=1382803 RepID=A0A2S9X0N4_9NEIS|nr:hypothetical protein [Chromobacterium amazonense]PRP69284.1 hypothetical protein BUE93_18015 [Chromobacterium amazonense]